jgi:hypothetical protein
MAVAKVNLETQYGGLYGQCAHAVAFLKANLPRLNAGIAATGDATAIQADTSAWGATSGSGQIVIDTAAEWNTRVQTISDSDAARGWQGPVSLL